MDLLSWFNLDSMEKLSAGTFGITISSLAYWRISTVPACCVSLGDSMKYFWMRTKGNIPNA